MSLFAEGDRVEFAPHLDIWIRGCRYGTVLGGSGRYNAGYVAVLPDRGPKRLRVHADNLTLVRSAILDRENEV